MKKWIPLLSFIFIARTGIAQNNTPLNNTLDHINGKIHYAITANHTQQLHNGYTSVGGDVWFPIGKRYTLNYNVRLGLPPSGGIYLHASDGLFLGSLLLANFPDNQILGAIGVILLFIPEGIGYYFGEGQNKLHLSVNPLTIDYRYRKVTDGEWATMGGNITARFHFPSKNDSENFFSPFIGLTTQYDNPPSVGIRAGISMGFHTRD